MALTVDNRNMFSNIDEINSDRSTWNLKAKIIRLWQVSDFNRPNVPFSVEMVLMDSDGAKIHATIKKTLIYKFKHDLIEGKVYSFENLGVASNNGGYRTTHHPYKLNFQFGSFVQRLSNCDIVKSPFTFVPIAEVVGGLYDTDFLVDVIGFLTEIGQEREITNQNGSTTKLNVISLEADGQSGSDENPSPLTFTQLSNEPTVTPLDEFLYNTPRATLQDLKDATKESSHVVSATVKRILNPDSYWYTSCFCGKGVIPDSRLWFCEKCNRHVPKVVPRFCVKLRVMDHTDSATLVVFDKEASGIFNMSCADMLQLGDADNDGEGIVPPRIDDSLVNQTWLFKVETKPSQNPRFEQSFRVRKICTDDGIIKQFKDKWDSEDAVRTKKRNECQNFSGDSEKGKGLIVDGTPVEVSQDLMLKFSESVVNLDDDSVNTPFSVKSMTYGNKQLTYAAAVNPTTSALAVKPNTSVIDVNEMTSVDVVKATTSAVFTQQSASAVNPLNSASGEDVSLKSSASGRPCGQRKKSFAKRVSPQHEDQDVEDDNAPIKLLKRAVKIEKIP
ncbi:unnamed protein product [Trifolium pratense]|uniref:Uncharacterized protein n=1 Tax=Trifolium pratense TaxID=57577 RepID=A0ACB0IWY9_TRIPR|nr:unnamed protein product [Trifolium pratense]